MDKETRDDALISMGVNENRPTINDAIEELKRFREIVYNDIDCDGLTRHVDNILTMLKSIEREHDHKNVSIFVRDWLWKNPKRKTSGLPWNNIYQQDLEQMIYDYASRIFGEE